MPVSAIALLIVAMLSIQSGAAIAKQLFPLVGSMGVTLLRTSLAAALLLGFWRPWSLLKSRPNLKHLALYGSALGFMNLLFYLSLERIPLGVAVALEFTGPLAVALFSSRKPLDFAWALIAAVGILLILPLTEVSADLNLYGALYALGAGGFWALYIIFGKKAGKDAHSGQTAAVGMLFAALVTIPFGLADSEARLWQWQVLPLGLAVAVFSSALPYSLEMYSLKRIPIKTFGILMSLEPVVAAIAGAVLLKEILTSTQVVAIVCIVAASLGTTLTAKKKPRGSTQLL